MSSTTGFIQPLAPRTKMKPLTASAALICVTLAATALQLGRTQRPVQNLTDPEE
jgi:hypothetical protein